MYIPPPDPGNLNYWNEEAKYRREMAGKGGLLFALIRLLLLLVKGVVWLLILPIRLSLSWWLRRRQKHGWVSPDRRNEI